MKPLEYLEQFQADQPDLQEETSELASLYSRKLWHPLTVKVEACFGLPKFNKSDLPYQLYLNFIADVATKLNLLKVAEFAVHAAKYAPDSATSMSFLESVVVKLKEAKLPRTAEPILFLRMHIAQQHLETSNTAECKSIVDEGTTQLESLSDVDPAVSAAVFYVTTLYHKSLQNFAEFYKSSLMYLSYVSSESLPADFKLRLAVDISLAALLGEHVYSFGQLLQHPIVKALDGTPSQWLHELLVCFNDGDLHLYDSLTAKYAAVLNSQPGLVANERCLREKITLMSLLSMISALPAENRRIALEQIAERTKLTLDGVEFVLMKALALHLIEGSIDQVDGYVQVTWVQPQVLTKPQVQGLKDRLESWITKVSGISMTLEQESVGVVEA